MGSFVGGWGGRGALRDRVLNPLNKFRHNLIRVWIEFWNLSVQVKPAMDGGLKHDENVLNR